MWEVCYSIFDEYGKPVAREMNLDTCLILLRALCNGHFAEETIAYTVMRQPNKKKNKEEE